MFILDFDGTMTDAEVEGRPFRAGFLDDLSLLTGRSLEEIAGLAETFETKIRAEGGAHGWVYDGHIVAPSTVDPYLRIMPVARMIFDECGCFLAEADRSRLLDAILFKYNYQKTGTVFKPEAREVLLALGGHNPYILSNSHTEPIQKKIRELMGSEDGGELGWLLPRVHGRAKKYIVDQDFDVVPLSMELPGLSRPVLLRRPIYHGALEQLRREHGLDWSDIFVAGDIFELDLALPLALGAQVALVTNDFTPPYEKAFLEEHPRGHVFDSLRDLLPFLA